MVSFGAGSRIFVLRRILCDNDRGSELRLEFFLLLLYFGFQYGCGNCDSEMYRTGLPERRWQSAMPDMSEDGHR